MFRLIPSTALILCLTTATALADHGKGAVGGKTISPRTLHEEDVSVDLGFRFQESTTFTDAQLLAGAAAGHDIHSVDWLAEFSVSISYGVTDQFNVSISLPFEVIRGFKFVDNNVGGPFVNGANSIVGIGDGTLMGKYSLLSDPVELAILAGVKVPSGDSSQLDNTGNLLQPDHQPGSGSWDPLIGVAVARQFEQFTLGASVLYKITTLGRNDFRPGPSVIFAVKGEMQILGLGKFPRLYGSVELSETYTGMDSDGSGAMNNDTGGNVVAIGFGLKVRVNEHVTFGASVSVPLYQGVNGLQHKERFEVLFGNGVDF